MSLTNKVLCVGLRTSCFGTSVQDDAATDEVLAKNNAERGTASVKKIRLKTAIDPIRKLQSAARREFNSHTLPGISEDLRIAPTTRLSFLQDRVKWYQDRLTALVDQLVANYTSYVEEDRRRLNGLFDPALYPSAEQMPTYFSINLTVCDMPRGDYDRIESLSADTIQQMRDEHRAMLDRIGQDARNEVFRKMTQLIQHIADKMGNPEAKKFHESTFDNLKEYLALVPDLNVTGDAVLDNMRKEAAEKLNFSIEAIRQYEYTRERAAASAKEILARYGSLGSGRKLMSE